MLSILEQQLFTDNDYEYDENTPCVSYSWKGKYSKTYNNETMLFTHAHEYITAKLNSNDMKTDKDNNIEIHNAKNTFYIDLDYLTPIDDTTKQTNFNNYLAKIYTQSFIKTMTDKHKDVSYYYFTFLCSEFVKDKAYYKGGVHVLVFCDKSFTKSERLDIYNNMNNIVKCNSKVWDTITKYVNNPETLFDEAPIKSCNILFPFGQKDKNKRQYVYKPELSKYDNQNWFVRNDIQTISLTIDHTPFTNDINDYLDMMEIPDDYEQPNDENKQAPDPLQVKENEQEDINEYIIRGNNNEKIYPENILAPKALIIYNFVSNFKYLSVNHPFWEILMGKHNEYYYGFVQHYYTMLVMLNMMTTDNVNNFNKYRKLSNKKLKPTDITYDILELVAKQLARICLTTKQNTDGEKLNGRFSYSEQLLNMKSMFYLKFHHKWFTKHRIDENGPQDLQTYINIYYTMKAFDNVINKDFIELYKVDVIMVKQINNAITKIRQQFKTTIDNFIKIITMFCEGITNEIEPFTKYKSYNHQICYVNDNDERLIDGDDNTNEETITFYHVDTKFNLNCDNNVVDLTYENTIKLWFSVCLTFNYISSNFQLQPAIKNTIGAFIKRYISVNMSGSMQRSDKYKDILIYNVRQTIELEKYPYNQWILDSKGNVLLDVWATKLYQHYIVDCLTQEFNDNKIYGFIKLFVDNSIYGQRVLNNIKVLPHADKDLNEMMNNIIKTHPTESWNAPPSIDIEKANIFPMRNGWLEFYWPDSNTLTGYEDNKTSSLHFSYNNRDKYTESHTNVPWVGDIDVYLQWIERPENIEAKRAYRRICEMCEQIYPIKEDLDYNMALFASVLYGNDEKNMIHIMFGTGADGKTTMTTAIFSMLDSEGYTNDVYITEHGRKIQVESLEGLGSTMKAETLLVSSCKSGGHDEGGRACMVHKRFISVAEPDQHLSGGNLNGAAIKEITGGGAIQARKIYKSAVSVQANSFITFQTNDFPGTDDTSKGFRRRLSVYQHRSKFRTNDELNDDKTIKNLEYIYPSDNSLNENLTKNIYYKQAMFYYLLPYAKRNIEHNWRSLQKIPKPKCVLDGINQVLSRASGITKWFCDNLDEYDKFEDENGHKVLPIINIASMISKMIKTNRENQVIKLWKKFADVNEEQKHLIRAIQNYFEQQIFKIQDKYYTSNGKSKMLNKNNKQLMNFLNATNIDHNKVSLVAFNDLSTLQSTYLSEHSVNSVSISEVSNYEDLFLVGYVMKTNIQKQNNITAGDDMDGYFDE